MEPRATRLLGASLATIGVLATAGAAVLFFFDPAKVGIYPVCYFHRLTGLDCPGCGGLRATHQLLHGNIAAAFQLNAFVVIAAPVLAWFGARFLYRALKGQPAGFEVRSRWLWMALAVLVTYGIVRNVIRIV